jgi:hypothetical protein
MARYLVRTFETTTVPSKPIPDGYKIWGAASDSYLLCWNWHRPKEPYGPVAIDPQIQESQPRGKKRKREEGITLNPTQSVVIALVDTLPKARYHVFLDNLFTSPDLFRALRLRGAAATGTARTNSGFYEPFVKLKVEDRSGRLGWPWNTIQAVPTEDNQV